MPRFLAVMVVLLGGGLVWAEGPSPVNNLGQVTVYPRATISKVPVTVQLPTRTPYAANKEDQARYLSGYAEGFARALRHRFP